MVETDGSSVEGADAARVRESLAAGRLLWLDLGEADEAAVGLLREVFSLHPIALSIADTFGQRPRIEDYENVSYLVAYGAGRDARRDLSADRPLVEVHCFYAPRFLVTLHREPLPQMSEIGERITNARRLADDRLAMLYRVLDVLADSLFPLLTDFDDRIDDLQDAIFVRPTDDQLSAMFSMKRWLVSVRKLVSPERDMLDSLLNGATELPGMTVEHERYFRALYDHLIRLTDLVDSYRDLLTDSMDAYLSVVSNRMNVIMKQLTVIATVFLPLTFLTGFFGQNFAWLVTHLGGLPVFLGAGIGSNILAVLALLAFLRKRKWI
jgi:magnesium transporter